VLKISNTLSVDETLHAFVEGELLPGTGVTPQGFWAALDSILADFTPRNAELLAKRDALQAKIDAWWAERRGKTVDVAEQAAFLREIGYLLPEPEAFQIGTRNVDPEIAKLAGPQLVVPVSNGRYALNAANARWGSLYDALYGTDALEPPTGGKGYDPVRGGKVIAFARGLLDRTAPLAGASHKDAAAYAVKDGKLAVKLVDGREVGLADPGQFAGWRGEAGAPQGVLLAHKGYVIRNRAELEAKQARLYAEAAEAFSGLPARQRFAFTHWGLRDPDSWLVRENRADTPLLFDGQGRPKAAAAAWEQALKS